MNSLRSFNDYSCRHIKGFREHLKAQMTFGEIAQSNLITIVEVDLELKIRYMDKLVEDYFNFTVEEAKGKSVLNFFHPDDQERMVRRSKELFTGGIVAPQEYKILKSDNTTFPVLLFSVPLYKDGKPYGIRAFTLDMSEYKGECNQKIEKLEEERIAVYRLINELKAEINEKYRFGDIISKDHDMLKIFEIVKTVASVPTSVLITGENGTGKELIAKQLHYVGERQQKAFVAVNSGALPDNLLEAELFGYKAGAFTDAKQSRKGKFVTAHGGTLFLDEIGDMPLSTQVKVLRALQERTITPLGSNEEIKVDVRLIAATNKNLERMVEEGTFREDLYYRIKVVKIEIPPLRERFVDIPLLSTHFLNHYSVLFGKNIKEFSIETLQFLMNYTFPGNIRELQNIVEHSVVFCDGDTIQLEHFPQDLFSSFETVKRKSERQKIIEAIRATGNNKKLAAEQLGIHKTTLFRKIKKYAIDNKLIA